MPNLLAPLNKTAFAPANSRWLNRWAKDLLHRQLNQLHEGEIILYAETTEHFGQPHADFPQPVHLYIDDEGFYGDVVFGGSIGAAEAYMSGFWHCSNLVDLVRLLVRNRHVLDEMDQGRFSWISQNLRRVVHALHRNTQTGSRRNIAAHYDLGNDFFKLFLDEKMMYSCAYFEKPEASLNEASLAKLERICQKLQLQQGDRVIEIGAGWGGFAIHAASRYGCHITTTTISQQQYDLAKERIYAAGLEDRITLLFQDYRDLKGSYDKLVSIEMVEAIGHQYYESYFAQCAHLLKPNGLGLIQAITILDQQYAQARDEVDFIKKHIFPGSCIPAITALLNAATRSSDLNLIHLEEIGPHYALTLRHWREAFMSQLEAVRQQGYSEAFIKMWEFYLAYCEGGYVERAIGNAWMLFAKPGYRY
jgi:cyclopropane-fatty-acyl-phospholipid synthase